MNYNITGNQVLILVCCIIGILLALSFLKKVLRLIVVGVLVVLMLVMFFMSENASSIDLSKVNIGKYESLASNSSSIKIENGTLKIKIQDTLVDVCAITNIKILSDEHCRLSIDGASYEIHDSDIVSLLKSLRSYS